MLKIKNIYEAEERINKFVKKTPSIRDDYFSELAGKEVYLKLENLQTTHAFKIRGSANSITQLNYKQREHGLITASTGNHGQGFSYMTGKLGIKGQVVVPVNAPRKKVDVIKRYGAQVIFFGESYYEASSHAHELAIKQRKTFIHSFDDEQFFAGNATIFLEMLQEVPDLNAIFSPIGGGGLISGLGFAAKSINPKIKVYGVEAEGAPSMYKSLQEGRPVILDKVKTIADGIAVKRPSDLSFSYTQKFIDGIFLVSDGDIKNTIYNLHEKSNLVVEGAGAAALAGLVRHGKKIKGKKIGVVLSGGNIDSSLLLKILRMKVKR